MKLSDFVASFISKYTKHVFLLPGGGNMHLIDSVGKDPNLEVVACLHEQGAAIAADGYAQFANGLGVALVTTGPGGTNAITGVAGAWVESVPLMILSGQVKTPDLKTDTKMRMLGFQEIDIVSIVSPITKYAVTVKDPQKILYHLEEAIFHAKNGRPGPVWLDIPLDIQAAVIDTENLSSFKVSQQQESNDKKQDIAKAVTKTIELLLQSKRPVILAGNGIRLSKAEALFFKVIEQLKLPVLTTWKACDLLEEEHPLFFGRPGTVAQRGANFIQQNADFILSLGCRLDFGQIGYAQETFAREARKVIVDIDELEFIKFRFEIDVKVGADVSEFLKEFEKEVSNVTLPDLKSWHDQCLKWKTNYPVVLQEYRNKKNSLSTYVLVDEISKQLVEKDVIVPCSSGSGADITSQSFKVKKGQRVLNSPGFGSMGFDIPQTIGACLASGRRRTVCVVGDGGFQLNIQELETIKRLHLPIKFFYLNNQGYVSIRTTQTNYFDKRFVATGASSGLTLPDIRKISDAYGIANNRIGTQEELVKGIEEALETDGPFICEVMIDPEEQVAPKVKSALGANGKMISKPLEDLAPFLSREEFLENMIVKPLEE
ncbi:MAG: thiamine pyrophosphate-binding protein [Segetibacter sp.]